MADQHSAAPMNPLESILQALFAQAKSRPDLNQSTPVATFAGRVAQAGESPQQVLRRMPMGSGEGDLPSALAATAGAVAQPAMQGGAGLLAKALLPKLLAAAEGLTRTSSAAIQPVTWQSMQPEAKAMLNVLGEKFPGFFQKLLQSPTNLMASVPTTMQDANNMGSLAMLRQGDQPTHAIMNVAKEFANEPTVALHEGQHMLNYPRVASTNPPDAATIGQLLGELLSPGQQNSLLHRTQQYNQYAPFTPSGLLQETGQLLNPQITRSMEQLNKISEGGLVNAGEGYYQKGESVRDFLSRARMDESLSYLAEQTQSPTGNPMLMNLAKQLGIGTGLSLK